MKMTTLHTIIQEACRKVLVPDERILAVYLLGSAARDQLRRESDIDIGIMLEYGSRMSAVEVTEIAGALSAVLERDTDIGLISSANLVYACEALFKGIPLFYRDEDRAKLMRANLLGMYLQFNRDRSEVLNAYRA